MAVRASAQWISEHSRDVSIDEESVRSTARELVDRSKEGKFSLSAWKEHPLNPSICNEDALDWIFLVDTLNFSFWHDDDDSPFTVSYQSKQYTGYWALCAAINRALDEGIPVTRAEYLASITEADAEHIFRSSSATHIPLMEERISVLREAGRVLIDEFEGSPANIISRAEHSAQALTCLLTKHFSSYDDVKSIDEKVLRFNKRAQIFVADVWACFEAKGYGEFHDIDTLTMFADYRVPQALVYFGMLRYSDELLEVLHKRTALESGSRLEIEIRGCSIWAVELLIKAMHEQLSLSKDAASPVNAVMVDFYLWDYAKAHSEDMKHIPIHRTRSIYY